MFVLPCYELKDCRKKISSTLTALFSLAEEGRGLLSSEGTVMILFIMQFLISLWSFRCQAGVSKQSLTFIGCTCNGIICCTLGFSRDLLSCCERTCNEVVGKPFLQLQTLKTKVVPNSCVWTSATATYHEVGYPGTPGAPTYLSKKAVQRCAALRPWSESQPPNPQHPFWESTAHVLSRIDVLVRHVFFLPHLPRKGLHQHRRIQKDTEGCGRIRKGESRQAAGFLSPVSSGGPSWLQGGEERRHTMAYFSYLRKRIVYWMV